MDKATLHTELSEPIVSENGILRFNFTFVTEHSGWFNVHDNDLGIEFRASWKFDPLTEVITLTIDSNNPLNPRNRITTHLLEVRGTLMRFGCAYDVVGE